MVMWIALVSYAVIGLFSGMVSGLLGVSGGFVMIPALILVFRLMDFPQAYMMQLAVGTALASMVVTSLASAYAHHIRRAVDWKLVKILAPSLVIGCVIGAFVGHSLPAPILELFFGLFALGMGYLFFRKKEIVFAKGSATKSKWNAAGAVIGGLSNMLGIGGGMFTTPLFVSFRMPMDRAIATSAATGVIITSIGALSYLIFGSSEAFYPNAIGYIYLPAFVILAVTAAVAAPYGASLTRRLPAERLKRMFALLLFVIALFMIY
jgi:uncharacterized membrane protein YfcA